MNGQPKSIWRLQQTAERSTTQSAQTGDVGCGVPVVRTWAEQASPDVEMLRCDRGETRTAERVWPVISSIGERMMRRPE